MNLLLCPLSHLALTEPNSTFIEGDKKWSYLNFEEYVQYIQKSFLDIKPNGVIGVKTICPYTTLAFFIACLRQRLIFFPINPKLPKSEVERRLIETKADTLIDKEIFFKPSRYFNPQAQFYYEPKAPCSYLLTSGSSSRPKICVHSAENYYLSASNSNSCLPFTKNDLWLLSLPLFHVGGLSLLFRTLLAKASLLISSLPLDQVLSKYTPTHISIVPTQLLRLLKKNALLQNFKVILLGGGPIPSSLLQKSSEYQLPTYSTYGLTEMTSQVATGKNNCLNVIKGTSLKIDQQSQILVKGPTLFLGYLENSRIKPFLNSEGWFETKDLGRFYEGRLQILGRTDNQFISGGENILPEEIENALLKHPQILEAIVIPQKDDEFGQVPVAFIRSDHKIQTEGYISFLEEFLPRFKIPKAYFPLSYEGLKPSRKKCKESLDKLLFR